MPLAISLLPPSLPPLTAFRITELTDETNRAQAFSIMPVTFAVGSALGPYIGGSLEHPRDKFPGMFHDQFWAEYPYFLPSVVAAGTTGISFFATLGWLKEGDSNGIRAKMGSGTSTENRTDGTEGRDRSTSIKDLILFPIIIAIANYAVLAMIDVSKFPCLLIFQHRPDIHRLIPSYTLYPPHRIRFSDL